MIQIYLSDIHCDEETSELSAADEPYVLVTAMARGNGVGASRSLPAFDVTRYGPFEDVDSDETHFAPGMLQSFWGIDGAPAALTDPSDAIFVVALMEHDAGRPGTLQGIVKGLASASALGSLSFARDRQVAVLLRDVESALGTPSSPSLDQDNQIGDPQELRFTRQELLDAESGRTVSKSMAFAGDGGRYTLTFAAAKRIRINAVPGATVTPLLPFDGHVEVFATSRDDGTVMSTFFERARNWQNWFSIRAEPPKSQMKPGATVTALQSVPGHVDLFATRDDGTVMSTFFEAGTGWRDWFEIHPEIRMSSGTTVTALQPFVGHVDLFATRDDGTVMSTFFEAGVWREWFPIRGDFKMSGGATVTALQPFVGHVDLFAVSNGIVMSTFFKAGAGWRDWFPIHAETKMHSHATVSVLQPFVGRVDLFATRHNGVVMSTFFDGNGGWHDWFEIDAETRMSSGATVTVLQPFPGHVDLFAVRDDGVVMTTFFKDGGGWRAWSPIGAETRMSSRATVTALQPFPGHVDLFAVRDDGVVVSTFFEDGAWREWFAIP